MPDCDRCGEHFGLAVATVDWDGITTYCSVACSEAAADD